MIRRALLVVALLLLPFLLNAQTSSTTIPRLVRFSGSLSAHSSANVTGVTFALYKDQEGGSPLWLETQNVSVDASHHYSVLLGAASKDGLPSDLFTSNEARWLGVKADGENELPRVLLVSVPYALKAGDAETLGGKPLSAFVLNTPATSSTSSSSSTVTTAVIAHAFTTPTVTAGAPPAPIANYIPYFVDTTGTNLTNSTLYQGTNGVLGINTTAPSNASNAKLHVNGNILLKGQTTHQIQMVGTASAGRLGQDLGGFFFAVDTAGKSMRVLTTPNGGVLTDNRLVVTSTGKVGIGTNAPNSMLSVVGTVESTSGGFKFPDGTVLATATPSPTVASSVVYTGTTTDQVFKAIQNQAGVGSFNASGVPSGLRGDSTTNTGYAAGVFGSASSYQAPGVAGVNLSSCDPANLALCNAYGVFGWSVQATHGTGVWGQADATTGSDNVGVFGVAAGDSGTGVEGYANNAGSGDGTGLYGRSDAPNGTGVWGYAEAATGNTVAVYGQVAATTGFAGLFDAPFNGNIIAGRAPATAQASSPTRVFRVDYTGKGFFNGGTQMGSADFAEAVDALGGIAKYEPGDVMMIDNTGTRRLALSTGAYSTKVAGIYSTKPGILGSEHSIDDPRVGDEVPLAIVGIVPCKVSAENGAIHAGDLLVTASRPGYAMKGTDRKKMLGAVVGKALGQLDKGTGTIEVLVSLH